MIKIFNSDNNSTSIIQTQHRKILRNFTHVISKFKPITKKPVVKHFLLLLHLTTSIPSPMLINANNLNTIIRIQNL